MALPTGTWYWSRELQDISYVPYMGYNRVLSMPLFSNNNNLEGAIRKALTAHRDYVLGATVIDP